MVDLATRMAARVGHPSAKDALRDELANNPPPPSKPIEWVPCLKRADIVVPPLGPNQYEHVYVVGFADYVKIGSSQDVRMRLFELQKHAPEELRLYALFAAGPQTERELHRRFGWQRLHGEWFALASCLKSWVYDGCPMDPPPY
jgi:hypothetical protein